MKNKAIFLLGIAFLTAHFPASAQDSSQHGAAKKINKTSEQADNLHGKKIQQQTLTNNRVEKLDSGTSGRPKKKPAVKHKRRQSRQSIKKKEIETISFFSSSVASDSTPPELCGVAGTRGLRRGYLYSSHSGL